MPIYDLINPPGTGARFGSNLASSLNQLLDNKLADLNQKSQQAKAGSFYEALGFEAPQAKAIVEGANSDQQNQIVKAILNRGGAFGGGSGNATDQFSHPYEDPASQRARLAREQREKLAADKEAGTQARFNAKQDATLIRDSKIAAAPMRKTIVSRKQDIQNQIKGYENVRRLNNKGDLQQGGHRQLLDRAGLGNVFLNPDSQEAKQELDIMSQQAGTVFGKQLSVAELNTFKSGIGSLANTKEGLERIIENRLLTLKGQQAYDDAWQEIYQDAVKKGQAIPDDIDFLAGEKAAPKLAELAEQWRENAAKAEELIKQQANTNSKKLSAPPKKPTANTYRVDANGKKQRYDVNLKKFVDA